MDINEIIDKIKDILSNELDTQLSHIKPNSF